MSDNQNSIQLRVNLIFLVKKSREIINIDKKSINLVIMGILNSLPNIIVFHRYKNVFLLEIVILFEHLEFIM